VLLNLFGGNVEAKKGALVPTTFGEGGAFSSGMFGALPGLLQNQPATAAERGLLGLGAPVSTFNQAGYMDALNNAQAAPQLDLGQLGGRGGPASKTGAGGGVTAGGGVQFPNPADFFMQSPGNFGAQPGAQDLALADMFQSRGVLQQGVNALPALLNTEPDAAIALARREFTEQTLPALLERAPGFSSSDLQREMMRSGTDLDTQIAALREAGLNRAAQVTSFLPQFAEAVGTNTLSRAGDILGFGQLGREFNLGISPAGDAFRVLEQLQSLMGPALVSTSSGSQSSKGGGV
jgi:hypothetical protein